MIRKYILGALIVCTASPALAHHPLAGAPMETFNHGVLSGFAHPILGFDHLAFVLLAGVAAALCGRMLSAPLGYVGGMGFGCLAMMSGIELPFAEVVIGASLMLMGYSVMTGRALSPTLVFLSFGTFGLFHGSAFGASIVGQESGLGSAVATGYLLGLCAVQYCIALGSGFVVTRLMGSTSQTSPVEARFAGAAVAGIGLFLTIENVESAVFAALGLS